MIVHPRFYDRWLSSAVAVVSQIVLVWVVAASLVLPGVLGLLPISIGWSDQLSRCNYDRAASKGQLSVVFFVGFIVPCVVMGYCYGMIWRRTREVRQRVDGYSAFRLLKTRQQNGQPVSAANRHPPLTQLPSNTNVVAHETPRSEPLLDAGNNRQLITEDDKVVDAYKSTSEQSSDNSRHTDSVIECQQGTAGVCRDRLLPAVDNKATSVDVDQPRTEISEDKALRDAPTTGQWSPTISQHPNTATCSSSSNKNDENNDDNEQTNTDRSRGQITTADYQQLMTSSSPASSSRKQETSSSEPSASRRSVSCVVEREKDESDGHVTNVSSDQSAADEAEEFKTVKHESISVIITPAVTVLRDSTTAVVASEVTDKNLQLDGHLQLQPLTEGDSAHLSVGQQQQPSSRMSSIRRRLLGVHEVGELSPASSSLTCHRHRSHSLRMILAVFFAFVLTYLPYTVTNLADQQARLDRSVYMMTSLAFWAGSCVNPVIYGIMNVQFRRAYVATLVNCWRHSVARFRTF